MKINNRIIKGPNVEVIIIPRSNGEDIIFKAQAVLDYEEFDTLCPAPIAPIIQKASGEKLPDFNDKKYIELNTLHNKRRMAYLILKSLQATEGLEWDTVTMSDPDSWINYENDLRKAGFIQAEINQLILGIMSANGLNEARIEEARKRFLASQGQVQGI